MTQPLLTVRALALRIPKRAVTSHIPALKYTPARAMSSSQPKEQPPKIIGVDRYETDAKWLRLEKIRWQDEDGKDRIWEVANRSTRSKGGVDSVHILALIHGERTSVVLIEQYRPPAGAVVLEFPAGLIDEGEDPATTAIRELHEETGYQGEGVTVRDVSPVLVKDPGMTGANMHLVTIDIKLPKGAPEPVPKLEPGEHIKKRIVALADLQATIKDYDSRGFAIDALVSSVAIGLSLAGK